MPETNDDAISNAPAATVTDVPVMQPVVAVPERVFGMLPALGQGFAATPFDRRHGIWGTALREDLDRRMDKRAQDFASNLTRERIMRQVMAIDAASAQPLSNDELSVLLDQMVRSV